MKNLWKFSQETGKDRGFLTIIILHSLEKKPKSGYDILKNLAEKTQGTWVPNKGTIYPILKSLEQEGLIRIKEIGKRSKIIYELTPAGVNTINEFRSQKEQSEEKLNFFKQMHLEIFGEENLSLIYLLMDIRFYVESLPDEKKEKALALLSTTFDEIKEM